MVVAKDLTRNGNVKLVAVSLSSECIKSPRCTFCYQTMQKAIPYKEWELSDALSKVVEKNSPETVSFEYNGYNLGFILHWITYDEPTPNITITTMPMLVTKTFCGFIKANGISAIAISYDREKCGDWEWIEKAKIAKKAGLKVSCNYLIPKDVNPALYVIDIPIDILNNSDQINLLIEKPNGKIKDIYALRLAIMLLKSITKTPIVTDNCLAVQLGFKENCGAGEEFIHILPNGRIVPCSFGKLCFLYRKGLNT